MRWPVSLLLAAMLGVAVLGAPRPAGAQPVDVPDTWGGDFWSRPRLTGSWGGLRDELGKKGVVFDADLLLTPQGVLTGGRDTAWEFWGTADYTLNVDTQKLGLWPGGFFKVHAASTFGDSLFSDTGALVPVNTAWLVGEPNEPSTTLLHATFMQFLSPKLGLIAGKIFTLDSDQGAFAGNFRTQFMNTGLVLPMSFALVPISAYGGGIIALPWEGVALSALVLDPSGTPENNDITEAFDDGVMVLASGSVEVKPLSRKGHQKVGFMWSDKTRLSLDQDPSNIARILLEERFPRLGTPGPVLQRILERFFPQLLVPTQRANREDSTWAMFYGFEQYLWHPGGDTNRGIGVFFTFGTSDGKANPIKYSYSMGIGGKGVVPGRPHDTFGVGWARTEFSGDYLRFLRQQLRLGLEREDAVEIFYNASLTSWLNATLDLQVIESALKKKLGSSGSRASTPPSWPGCGSTCDSDGVERDPPGPAALDGPGPELKPHVRGMPLDGRPQELRRDDAARRHCVRRDQRRLRGVSRRRQPPCGLGSPGGRPRLEKLAALIPRPRTNLVVYHGVLAPHRGTPSVSAVLVEESPALVVGSPRGCSVHHRLGEQDDRPRRDLRNDHAGGLLRGLVIWRGSLK